MKLGPRELSSGTDVKHLGPYKITLVARGVRRARPRCHGNFQKTMPLSLMFYHDHRCSPQSARFCNNYYHPICDITATLQEYKPVARARPPSRTPPPISPSEKPDAWRATDAISPPSIYRLLMEINNRANSILTRSNKRTNERIQLGATRALSLSLSLSRHDRAQLRVDSGDTGKNQGDNSAGPGYNAIVKSRNRGFKHT